MVPLVALLSTHEKVRLKGVSDVRTLVPGMTLVTIPAEVMQTTVMLRASMKAVTGMDPPGPLMVLTPIVVDLSFKKDYNARVTEPLMVLSSFKLPGPYEVSYAVGSN